MNSEGQQILSDDKVDKNRFFNRDKMVIFYAKVFGSRTVRFQ